MASNDYEIANMALSLCGVGDAGKISALTDSTKEARECNRWYTQVLNELLESLHLQDAIVHTPLILTPRYHEWNERYDYDPVTITGITNADPAVVTAASHPFSDGDHVYIYDVAGMTEVNRDLPFLIGNKATDTFELTGVDSTNWTAYSSGGECRKMAPLSKYQDGYSYEVPSDLVLPVSINDDRSIEFRIVNGELLTTVEDAVLVYVKSLTTVSSFSALFVKLFSIDLALNIVVPLMGVKVGAEIKKQLYMERNIILNRLNTSEALGNLQFADTKDSWVDVR